MRRDSAWVTTGREGAVIVASILLAFAIDASWDARRERASEQALLAAVRDDMVRNQKELERALSVNRQVFAKAVAFLESSPERLLLLDGDSATTFTEEPSLFRVATFDASDGTLRNRDLSVLRDQGLLSALGDWSGLSENLREGNRPLLDFMFALRTHGAEVAPEFFMNESGVDARSLSALRADREFVATQLTLQTMRRVSTEPRLAGCSDRLSLGNDHGATAIAGQWVSSASAGAC